MDPTILFGALTVIYGMLFFFDRFFKSCMHYPYDAFLKNTGLTVQFMRLRWHTTAFNRAVLRWGSIAFTRSWLIKGFTVGVLFALSMIPVGIILLIITIFSGNHGHVDTFTTTKTSQVALENFKVEILLPGINLPLEEIGFYIITLLISTVVHELGHALAAVLEDIPVTGFGFQLFFCLPLAYTELSSEHLNSLKWFKKLRILCAGIWHNFLFASFCYLLFYSSGYMTKPFYHFNRSVVVTDVANNSPLRAKDHRGIEVGNIITMINNCRVNNEESWYRCLVQSLRNKPAFCVSSDFIRLNDESIEISHHGADGMLQCCDANNLALCCFEYVDDFKNDAPVEIPQHVCLNIRSTIEKAEGYCVNGICERGFCMRPLLRNTTTIFKLERETSNGRLLRDIIYVGYPGDLTRTIRISAFVPKQKYISPKWGDAYTLFLKYNIVFSIGLALVNAIPCFGFDGYHIVNTIINSFLVNRVVERPKRDVIGLIVTAIGTLIFVVAVMKVMWISVLRHLF